MGDGAALALGLDVSRRIVRGEDFVTDLLTGMESVFGADGGVGLVRWSSAGGPDPVDAIDVTVAGCPPVSPSYIAAGIPVAASHPGIVAMERHGTEAPVRLSDVVDLRRFWTTEVFQRMHWPASEARYPMSALVAGSARERVFVAVHRSHRDFSDADVHRLSDLQRLLAAAWQYRRVQDECLSRVLAAGRQTEIPEAGPALTGRQTQVLDLLTEGWTNTQIGRRLGISERTVRKHVGAVYEKFHLTGRAAAAAWWQGRRSLGD